MEKAEIGSWNLANCIWLKNKKEGLQDFVSNAPQQNASRKFAIPKTGDWWGFGYLKSSLILILPSLASCTSQDPC